MRGMIVIIRTFESLPLVRKVWEYNENAVYIADDETFIRLSGGDKDAMPIGFPREDVFIYDPIFLKEKCFEWNKLTIWDG